MQPVPAFTSQHTASPHIPPGRHTTQVIALLCIAVRHITIHHNSLHCTALPCLSASSYSGPSYVCICLCMTYIEGQLRTFLLGLMCAMPDNWICSLVVHCLPATRRCDSQPVCKNGRIIFPYCPLSQSRKIKKSCFVGFCVSTSISISQ